MDAETSARSNSDQLIEGCVDEQESVFVQWCSANERRRSARAVARHVEECLFIVIVLRRAPHTFCTLSNIVFNSHDARAVVQFEIRPCGFGVPTVSSWGP